MLVLLVCAAPSAGAPPRVEWLITADRLFDGDRMVEPGAVAVSGGRVVAVGPAARSMSARRVRAFRGATIVPGLVDLHVHGLGCGQVASAVTSVRDLAAPLAALPVTASPTRSARRCSRTVRHPAGRVPGPGIWRVARARGQGRERGAGRGADARATRSRRDQGRADRELPEPLARRATRHRRRGACPRRPRDGSRRGLERDPTSPRRRRRRPRPHPEPAGRRAHGAGRTSRRGARGHPARRLERSVALVSWRTLGHSSGRAARSSTGATTGTRVSRTAWIRSSST